MSDPIARPAADPNECTTPEAWAELVRSERHSALQMMQELALARGAVAHLGEQNSRLLALLAGRAAQPDEGAN